MRGCSAARGCLAGSCCVTAIPTFQKLGGEYQLVLQDARDLAGLLVLDEVHWVATGAPCSSFTCDEAFLQFLDNDGNGRVRTDEVRAAVRWLLRLLRDPARLAQRTPVLRLADINADEPEGEALHRTATRILYNLGQEDTTEITLEQVRDRQRFVQAGACNGDGIIPPEVVEDPEARALAESVLQTVGGETDAGGSQGITTAGLDAFLAAAQAHLEWHDEGRLRGGQSANRIMVQGERTPAAQAALSAIADKVDEYFSLCRLVQVAPTAEAALAERLKNLPPLAPTDGAAVEVFVLGAPLCLPRAEEVLPLVGELNPAWEDKVRHFVEVVLQDAGSPASISREEWEALKAQFAPYAAWQAGKRGAVVEALGPEALRERLDGGGAARLREMIAADQAVAADLEEVADLERLILYQQWLLEFANNFAALPRLFDPATRSMVEQGTLVMEGRRFDLCVEVADRAAHIAVTKRSNICVLYLEIADRHSGTDRRREIAVAVTSGYARNLYKGKRGVFFAVDGAEWDAVVVDLVANPVGLNEALLAPFRHLVEFVGTQLEKFTSARQKALEARLGKGITEVEASLAAPPAKPATSTAGGLRDLMLGGSVAVAALGSAFAFITKSLATVSLWSVVKVLLGILVVLALPTLVVAVLKVRRRNLGMFLEACGWSVNAPLRLTRRLGLLFTREPALPKGARRRRFDQSRTLLQALPDGRYDWTQWVLGILFALLVGGAIGLALNRLLPVEERVSRALVGAAPRESSPIGAPPAKPTPSSASPSPAAPKQPTVPAPGAERR